MLAEALPFIVAGIFAQRLLGKVAALVPYVGCGCVSGPSARSLPATAFTVVAFGPFTAIVRFIAAVSIDRVLRKNLASESRVRIQDIPDVVAELERFVPFASTAAAGLQIVSRLDLTHAGFPLQIAAGAALGFFGPPCAVAAIPIASTLRVHTAAAATAFLCVAGIVDLNAFRSKRACDHRTGDACAYTLLAVAAGFVAYRSGADLVRPAFAPVLALCAVAAVALAIANRTQRAPRFYLAPIFILSGALVAVPPPVYRATETTLSQAFPGERLTFTGRITKSQNATTLVRFAIICCRADASPVVIRLAKATTLNDGTWTTATGTIVPTAAGLALDAKRLTPVPPPSDPFVYR